LIPWIILNS